MGYTAKQYLEAGIYCVRQEDWRMAVNPLREAIKMGLDTPELRMYLGLACIHLKEYKDALAHLESSVQDRPDRTAESILSTVYEILGMDAETLEIKKNIAKKYPVEYPFQNRIWDHKGPLEEKTVLVHMFDGYGIGDVIQYMRHIRPFKKKYGCQTLVSVTPDVECLFRTLAGVDNLTVAMEGLTYDVSASLEDVRLLTAGLPTPPVPYTTANREFVQKWAAHTSRDKFKVGVCWRSSRGHLYRTKSVPLKLFKPLMNVPGVELYSLQVRAGDECYQENVPLVNIGGKFYAGNFEDAAGATECMDLVISIDSAIAHLAGAIGKRVWCLLPFAPAGRWKLDVDETDIYPTMRLFRQPAYGDWQGCFDKVKSALEVLAWQWSTDEKSSKSNTNAEALCV